MYEDSFLDSYWEERCEPYQGEDYNVFEEDQIAQDMSYENWDDIDFADDNYEIYDEEY